MATEYLFSNNATTTLAQSISATATVLNVASGTGGMFPNPGQGQAFAVTLVDAATGLTNEICYCTSRSGDQLTVTRGQEGTNATSWQAGDTCANYITADVMESWLQESDLNGYATQSWSNSAFVKNNNGNDGGIVSADMDASGVPAFLSGKGVWYQVQLKGDYATNAALSTEASSRTSADANLQNQVNNRVYKGGDIMTGGLTIEGNTGGFTAQYNPGSPSSGSFINYPGFTSIAEGRGGEFHCQVQEHVGYKFIGLFSLRGSSGNWRYVSYPEGARINDSDYGDVAYTADLPTSGTINGGYFTKIGNILRQTFDVTLTPDSNGNATITFPQAYSSPPKVIGMGSVETTQNHSAIALNQTNSSGVLTSATQAFLHFSTGAGTSSVQQSVVNITVEGIA